MPNDPFTRTIEAASRAMTPGFPLGIQLYVSRGGETIVDVGLGEAGDAGPMRADTVVPWFSAGKPVTALCVALLHDAGQLDLDDPVVAHLPEFDGPAKRDVRLCHLLSHSVAFARDLTTREVTQPWDQVVQAAAQVPVRPGTVPGGAAAYSPFLAWQLLAEVVQRSSGLPFDTYVRRHVIEPLGMDGCYFAVPAGELAAGRVRVAQMFDTSGQAHQLMPWVNDSRFWTAVVPGTGGRGPVRGLGALYEALLGVGPVAAALAVLPATLARMTSTQRAARFDPFYGATVDWGLGFITDRRLFGGRLSSDRVFGHDGHRCALTFADPHEQLVVCAAANALPTTGVNYRRFRLIVDVLFDELGRRRPDLVRDRSLSTGHRSAQIGESDG